MGYRSEVYMVIKDAAVAAKPAQSRMVFEWSKMLLSDIPWVADLNIDGIAAKLVNGVFELELSSVKWYPDYKDVVAYDSLWRHFEAINDDHVAKGRNIPDILMGSYIVIGEDADDIQEHNIGEGWECARVVSSVEKY